MLSKYTHQNKKQHLTDKDIHPSSILLTNSIKQNQKKKKQWRELLNPKLLNYQTILVLSLKQLFIPKGLTSSFLSHIHLFHKKTIRTKLSTEPGILQLLFCPNGVVPNATRGCAEFSPARNLMWISAARAAGKCFPVKRIVYCR